MTFYLIERRRMTLPWDTVAAALIAALLHAAWNAGLKGGNDRILDASLLFAVAGMVGLLSTFFVPQIDASAWKWIAITSLLHLPYVYFLAKAYELGELSHVYTIARGLPPIMITVLATFAVAEVPTPQALAGVILISFGILTVGLSPGAHVKGTVLAGIVAVTIALYSISDGIGVRTSQSPIAYNGWVFFAVGVTCLMMAITLRGDKIIPYARLHWRRAVFGGVLSFLAYGLVLWAMTKASIAGVSALRETSVVFAAMIGILLFGEKAGARRIIGALVVAMGALVLKFA
jgi:drug/metabolite transporter (DMT)-like permease